MEALIATSPRKSPTPKKSIKAGSTKPRKSVRASTKGENRHETPHESTQETERQLKVKKPTSRKLIKVVDFGEKGTQGMMHVMAFQTLVLIPDT